MDAFDTYFRHNMTTIVELFYKYACSIVISTEINFAHQPNKFKQLFDRKSYAFIQN